MRREEREEREGAIIIIIIRPANVPSLLRPVSSGVICPNVDCGQLQSLSEVKAIQVGFRQI